MAKIFLNIFLLGIIFLNPVKLKVIITNIQVGKGNIVVEIYDNENDFFKKAVVAKTVKASNDSLVFVFEIPAGTYAVAAYQDLNDNKILDKGIFNIPKEPYGLSTNYRPHFSAPHFSDCRFKITQDSTTTITLK